MRSDGQVLPDVGETVVLRRLGLVRTDLSGIAARWLVADLVDSEAVRVLGGQDPHDAWVLDELTRDIRWAVATLARLGESDPELGMGLFVGLDDEWVGGWGRGAPELEAEAETELVRIRGGQRRSDDGVPRQSQIWSTGAGWRDVPTGSNSRSPTVRAAA